MKAITDRPAFREAAKEIPDFSYLDGVKLAVAVTGFESKEIPVSGDQSILNFTPRFVAILETNAWNYQALAFTEHKLGEFINNVYDGEVLLETAIKHDGKYFVWTANDGRKAFALVQGSVVFFGNDESSIEKSLAVKRGEADPISKSDKVPPGGESLAVAHISNPGIGQLANIVSIKKAKEFGDEEDVQSFVARVLPQLIQGSIQEASWVARWREEGIEDNWTLLLKPEIAHVFSENVSPSSKTDDALFEFVSAESFSTVTQYNFRNPKTAWQGAVTSAQKLVDPLSSNIIAQLSKDLFVQYGISDIEKFLGSVSSSVVTIRNGKDDNVAIVVRTSDVKSLRQALDSEFMKSTGAIHFYKEPGYEGIAVIGHPNVVNKSIHAHLWHHNLRREFFARSAAPEPPIVRTKGYEENTRRMIADALGVDEQQQGGEFLRPYTIETHINETAIERRTVSDFGFIGWLITQFGSEQ